MSDFETELRKAIEADPDLKRKGKRILKVLDMRPSKRKERILERMEAHVRATIYPEGVNTGSSAEFDWSTIDWTKLLGVIVQVLLALLPFLL